MKTYIVAYLATGFAFLAADAVWLTGMNRILYQAFLGPLLLPQFKLAPAALFYLIYVLGIVFFAVTPALATGQWSTALLRGAAFGLVAYATYDLTNQATLKDWPMIVTVADMAWGTIATATGATVGFLVTQAVGKALSG
jgi:uncharacterized membrane protein